MYLFSEDPRTIESHIEVGTGANEARRHPPLYRSYTINSATDAGADDDG
jgi:hypothetical protein